MGQITATRNLVATKVVRHAGQSLTKSSHYEILSIRQVIKIQNLMLKTFTRLCTVTTFRTEYSGGTNCFVIFDYFLLFKLH